MRGTDSFYIGTLITTPCSTGNGKKNGNKDISNGNEHLLRSFDNFKFVTVFREIPIARAYETLDFPGPTLGAKFVTLFGVSLYTKFLQ